MAEQKATEVIAFPPHRVPGAREAPVPDGALKVANGTIKSRLRHRFFGLPSAGDLIDKHGGAGPGFDTLRIVLSLTILVYHAKQVALGRAAADYAHLAIFPFLLALVPMFFCLSGFLVTGSALRTRSIATFLANRGLRIFPALAVEVALSALVLGPLLTTVALDSYFSHRQFFAYFGNIVGRVRMSLPGVFIDNPISNTVNASLWTLQPEFYCYLLMTALMATAIVFRRHILTALYAAITVALSLLNWFQGFGSPSDVFPWHVVVYYFITGVVAFHWKNQIPIHFLLFLVALVCAYFMVSTRGLIYLASLPITYCVIYAGMQRVPLPPLLNGGDYSYGIYLFNFPIQQSVVHFFPAVREWWLLLLISVPLTVMFSATSWHYIEKPALALKRRMIPRAADAGPNS